MFSTFLLFRFADPGICVRIFSALKCTKVVGLESASHSGYVMAASYDVECWVGRHAQAVSVSLVCVGVWVMGIPLSILLMLRMNKAHLYDHASPKHKEVVAELGTLFLQYEPRFYWW